MALHTAKEAYQLTIDVGVQRGKQSLAKTLLLSFMGGSYIAMGGFLALRASSGLSGDVWFFLPKLLFGCLFPVGLTLILLTGVELFTSNCMTLLQAFYNKKIKIVDIIKSLTISWLANFLGATFFAYFFVYQTGLVSEIIKINGENTMPVANSIVNMANAKVSLTFNEAFLRGIAANWLVCLAVYLYYIAKDMLGKIVCIFLPVATFVALGFEHSIANMFFVPLGIFIGNDANYLQLVQYGLAPALKANWTTFTIDNLLPVTLGNFVGGAVFVAGFYTLLYANKKDEN